MDTENKRKLLEQWISLTSQNRECDILVVDSASPIIISRLQNSRLKIKYFSDNIGHLSRGGRDGWGRAFCYGIEAAIDGGYDYVVHIEGDSLFRLPVEPIIKEMEGEVLSISVKGTKRREHDWVETGLMFFDVDYLIDTNFIERYNWRDGSYKKYPNTPEAIIRQLVGSSLRIAPWNGMRDDCNVLTIDNLKEKNLDWITHCKPEVFDLFAREALDHGATVGD